MAEFSRLVITGKGQALLAKMIAEGCNIAFTKVSASSAEYTDAQLEELTELSEIRQTSLISKVIRTNEVAVKIEAAFTNTELAEGYYIRALGLYAEDPDEGEILYAVTREVSGNCYIPAYDEAAVSGAYVQLVTTVGNAENVTLEVDSGAYATMGDIKTLEAKLGELSEYLGGAGAPGDIGFVEGIEADNVIGAINEVFQSGNEKKSKLVENLVAMGIEASTDETWESLLDKVLDMTDTSGDTVTAAALLSGYTAHNAAGEQITGVMADRRGTTVEAAAVTQDDGYTYLSLPEGEACYDAGSRVRAMNSDIKSQIPFFVSNVKMINSGQWDRCTVTFTYLYDCEISGVSTSASENTINGYHTAGSTTTLGFSKAESTDMEVSIDIDISNMKITFVQTIVS